jgi:hypothetical protein
MVEAEERKIAKRREAVAEQEAAEKKAAQEAREKLETPKE